MADIRVGPSKKSQAMIDPSKSCAVCGHRTTHQVGAKIAGRKYRFCSRACRSEVKRQVGGLYGR